MPETNAAVPLVLPEVKYDVVVMPIKDVDPSEWNPPRRLGQMKMRDLKASLLLKGQLQPIHAIRHEKTGRVTTFDGHRRREALLQLGVATIKVALYEGGTEQIQDLFAAINEMLNHSDPHSVDTGLVNGPVKNVRSRCTIDTFRQLFTKKELSTRIIGKASTSLLTVSKRTMYYAWPELIGKEKTGKFKTTLKVVVLWMIEHQAQDKCNKYINPFQGSYLRLRKAIINNKPVPGF